MKNYDLYLPRYIPVEVIHPIVKKYCDSRDMGPILLGGEAPHQITRMVSTYSAADALSFESGVHNRTVHDIYRGKMAINSTRKKRPTQVKWTTVDKLLTAMGLTHLWYEEPLSDYYIPRPSPGVLQDVLESAA